MTYRARRPLLAIYALYDLANKVVASYPYFRIDLSELRKPETASAGDPSNRISYTFARNFPKAAEVEYREFLKRVFPIIYERLGPPAETFTVRFVPPTGAHGSSIEAMDRGRMILSDGDFLPRLLVHELVHVWTGKYAITRDKDWNYNPALSGFEEGMAEALAFEIVQEYVRSYPGDIAATHILSNRPHQYWAVGTSNYDAIKNVRWTGAGEFRTHFDGPLNRYTISGATVQMMLTENPDAMKGFMARYYEAIRRDPEWRPNREDIIDMWESEVPQLNGYPLGDYLDTLPVFNGRKLDEGVYVLENIGRTARWGTSSSPCPTHPLTACWSGECSGTSST